MTLDDHVSVLILLTDYVKDSSQYPAFKKGMEEFSLPGKLPEYASFGVNTVVAAHLPQPLVDLLQGHTLVRRVYTGLVPLRDYDRINPRLHSVLQKWDARFIKEPGLGR